MPDFQAQYRDQQRYIYVHQLGVSASESTIVDKAPISLRSPLEVGLVGHHPDITSDTSPSLLPR